MGPIPDVRSTPMTETAQQISFDLLNASSTCSGVHTETENDGYPPFMPLREVQRI
jgi:hypothetical protein